MRTFNDIQPGERLNLEELAQINGGADPPPAICKTIACTLGSENAKCNEYVCVTGAYPAT